MNQLVQYRREFHYFPDIGWRDFGQVHELPRFLQKWDMMW